VWSPDSKKLAFADKNQRLRYVEVDGGRIVDVDRGRYADITEYTWSPDSRWIAYSWQAPSQMSVIRVHSLDRGTTATLTDELVNNYAPVFDPGGRYLYFLSDRDYNLTFSDFEFSYIYTKPTRLYVGTLTPDIKLPFVPRSDEETPDGEETGDEETGEEEATIAEIRIEPEGFPNRVMAIPGPAGDYRSLAATADALYYLIGNDAAATLKRFRIEDEEDDTILEGIQDYVLARDGNKVLYLANGKYGIVDTAPGQKSTDGHLDLGTMDMKVDPPAEWRQMFADAWRLLRDWFYDPNLHGLDWEAVRRQYEPFVDHLARRADLDFILGEMGAELSAGHVYVQPGDQTAVERTDGGLLGAELEADASGYYRIVKIFPGENWHPDFRSPLTEPGVTVKEDDFLLAIDGKEVTTAENPYRHLEDRADRVVTLLVNDRPRREGAREENVRPVARETNLRYLDWVLERRRMVDEASGGRIGYLHLPDTATEGNREMFKYFYPQANTEALVVDVRFNGGGFVPDRMIELLDRPVLNYWVRRDIEANSVPGFAHQGPKVCLINGHSGSGGDAFPYYFRKRGLGSVIGTRTWGGLIGISNQPNLMDGGNVTVPQFRFLDTDGRWVVENEGVAPDIEVIDRPDLVARGQDPALERAIELLMEELRRNPAARPEVPPPPTQEW
jgi:tricorn protease